MPRCNTKATGSIEYTHFKHRQSYSSIRIKSAFFDNFSVIASKYGKNTELGQYFDPVKLYLQGFCLKFPKF